jgi:hypothetical protein
LSAAQKPAFAIAFVLVEQYKYTNSILTVSRLLKVILDLISGFYKECDVYGGIAVKKI